MLTTFDAIGLPIDDLDAYSRLLRWVGDHGKPSIIARRGSVLRGRCVQIGEGLELWSTAPGQNGQCEWPECRPAFRSHSIFTLSPWELTEYEDGQGALLGGMLSEAGVSVFFELQNLTEIDGNVLAQPELRVSVAGIAYTARVLKKNAPLRFRLVDPLGTSRYVCESDYWIRGRVRRVRTTQNHLTGRQLLVASVETGKFVLDVLVNPECVKSGIREGDCLSARVWLQGYLFDGEALQSRYEGVDLDYSMASAWRHFRKEH